MPAKTANCECPPRSKQGQTVVARPTRTTTAGSTATTYANVSRINCRWFRKSGRDEQVYGARRVRRQWETEVDVNDDIQRGDRCTFTDATGEHEAFVIDTAVDKADESKLMVEAEELT